MPEYNEIIFSTFFKKSISLKDKVTQELITEFGFYNQNNEYKKFLQDNCDEIVKNLDITCSKILVKGEVQSGKTYCLMYIVAMAIINHNFNFIIFQTGQLNDINKQNYKRFKSIFQKLSVKVNCYNYKKEISEDLCQENVILFGIKSKDELENIFNNISSMNRKILIIGDEYDKGSMTNLYDGSMSKIINLHKASYLNITATPYNILLEYNQENYFNFYKALSSPGEYKGIEYYFKNKFYIVNTVTKMTQNFNDIFKDLIYESFKNKKKFNLENGNILINTSTETVAHDNKHKEIKSSLKKIYDEVCNENTNYDIIYKKVGMQFEKKELCYFIKTLMANIKILNSKSFSDCLTFDNKYQIIIGGIKLSRGITFKNLLSEIIIIDNKGDLTASDIMQKARWFGYHNCDTIVYMNFELSEAYKECVLLEKITNNFLLKEDYGLAVNKCCFKFIKIEKPSITRK